MRPEEQLKENAAAASEAIARDYDTEAFSLLADNIAYVEKMGYPAALKNRSSLDLITIKGLLDNGVFRDLKRKLKNNIEYLERLSFYGVDLYEEKAIVLSRTTDCLNIDLALRSAGYKSPIEQPIEIVHLARKCFSDDRDLADTERQMLRNYPCYLPLSMWDE